MDSSLKLKPFKRKLLLIICGITLLSLCTGFVVSKIVNQPKYNIEHEHLVMLLNESEKNEFNGKVLYQFIQDINVKFPDIVFAQAVLETRDPSSGKIFNSPVFIANNNLFGMKEASRRPTMSKGTELNHAYYDNWKHSVIDYALYQARYLNQIKTREQYFEYLSKNYAEDPKYVPKINSVLKSIDKYIK